MHVAQYKQFFLREATGRLAEIEDALVVLERDPASKTAIQKMLVSIHTLKGDAATMSYRHFATALHQCEEYLLEVQKGDRELAPPEIDQFFILMDTFRDNLLHIQRTDTELDLSPKIAFMLRVGAVPEEQKRRRPQGADEGAYEPISTYVEVASAQMDESLDGINNIIAHNQRMLRLVQSGDTGALAVTLQSQASQLSSVRQLVVDMKMMPVKQYFGFLSRLVRDLSREGKKFITLAFSDHGLRFEKQVLESVRGICVQLIRNAVEHGFNEGDRGTVTIEFTSVENSMYITVCDTGHGIQWNAIADRAVIEKKITREALRKQAPKEREHTLFELGVSSRERATIAAGRGLGWASVRADAQALDAEITIMTSSKGRSHGTTVTLKVPLTPSMFRAITWCWGSYYLAIPLFAVENIIQLPEARRDIGRRFKVGRNDIRVGSILSLLGPHLAVQPLEAEAVCIVAHENVQIALPLPSGVHEQELIMQQLPCLAGNQSIMGVAVSEFSLPVTILNYTKLFDAHVKRKNSLHRRR